uniref:RETRotransposonlike family member (Retr1)like [Saccoglossus kowalevskii] n=1 Tax=Lepeophtheirus salmonis TaxID=72036 RepID=A0A0K2U1F8_LEPSM
MGMSNQLTSLPQN